MQYAVLVAGLAALVAAAPAPTPQQNGIDFDVIKAAGKPVVAAAPLAAAVASATPTYDSVAAAAKAAAGAASDPIVDDAATKVKRSIKLGKRDNSACSTAEPQPSGAGPVASPDTDTAFYANPAVTNAAASAPTAFGYAQAFSQAIGSTGQAGYMGFFNLQSYDTIQCAHHCDNADGCAAFNIYFERDPTVAPGQGCDDPPSTTTIKCVLWGLPVSSDTATNQGQYRSQFHIAIAGSNGYNSLAPPPSYPTYTGPSDRLGGAIQAPLLPDGSDPYVGSRMYPGVFDPSQCAAACTETNTYDHDHPAADGTYKPCNFFNAYVISQNGQPSGTYCTFYTAIFGRQYATNQGGYDGQGNRFDVSESYSYSLTNQDSGVVGQ